MEADRRHDEKNYVYMIQRFASFRTANRTYFLSRSQPPFFAAMVKLLASKPGRRAPSLTYLEYFPSLLAEYKFWMKGQRKLSSIDFMATNRVVAMPDAASVNRYYDDKATPRPESRREDIETARNSRPPTRPRSTSTCGPGLRAVGTLARAGSMIRMMTKQL